MKHLAHRILDPVARRFGYKPRDRPYSEFLEFKKTLRAAKTAGLSVGEYIERKHAIGSRTALVQTMDGLASLGLFGCPIERICEIGPGSGRYLEKVMERVQPGSYEIYETSSEWREWLVRRYGVTERVCDGRTLAESASCSVDLVHAHKVFGGGLPFLNSVSYFREMARVVRDGGWVVFDIMTEACFREEHLDAWFDANPWEWAWAPHIMPREYAVGLFAEREVAFVGSFQVPLFPGTTECMVFRKIMANSTPSVSTLASNREIANQ
jgi:SAM-dependent methyltransferase